MRFDEYWKNKEGLWDYNQFEDQVVALVDAMEQLHPDNQIVREVDWLQGHDEFLGTRRGLPLAARSRYHGMVSLVPTSN